MRLFDKTMRKGMMAGAVLGVFTAAVLGVGSSFGAESGKPGKPIKLSGPGAELGGGFASSGQAAGTWQADEAGSYRYYGQDGQMWANAVTPDGYYVDAQGVWIPDTYQVSRLTSIPSDAKSLMVIEGYGTAARATFYVRNAQDHADAGQSAYSSYGPGMVMDSWTKVVDTGGYVGWNGIGKEKEGDQKTPRGLFTLDEAFGTKPDPGTFRVPYLQVDEGYYWVGDQASPYYNTMVDIRRTGAVFNTEVSEHLSTYGGSAYHYCMAVGYNKEQTPGKGSAIFLHCTDGGQGTGGCIAIPEAAMVTVLQNMAQPAYILIDDGANLRNW